MSLPKSFCLSSASAALTTPASLASFPDHYAVLGLDLCATSEEVKSAFRKLRAEYFATDAKKYRELQVAYAVLVDREARGEYDALYRARMGLPPQTDDKDETESVTEQLGSFTISRCDALQKNALVKEAVSRIDAGTSLSEEKRRRAEAEKREELRRRDAEEAKRLREEDPNWGLKHFSPQYESVIGSVPYHSFVPVAHAYQHAEGKPRSRRPMYVGNTAKMSMP